MSSKKRKLEILLKSRIKRIKNLEKIDVYDKNRKPPADSVKADHDELKHNNTYGPLPLFYVDKLVVCKDCGKQEVWRADQQKWWYEVAKGHIDSKAVKCRDCRKQDREKKAIARKIHLEGIEKKNKIKDCK